MSSKIITNCLCGSQRSIILIMLPPALGRGEVGGWCKSNGSRTRHGATFQIAPVSNINREPELLKGIYLKRVLLCSCRQGLERYHSLILFIHNLIIRCHHTYLINIFSNMMTNSPVRQSPEIASARDRIVTRRIIYRLKTRTKCFP